MRVLFFHRLMLDGERTFTYDILILVNNKRRMSKKQYLKALNAEIQKLNEIIDVKILHECDYKREARRHKRLLAEIRRREVRRSLGRLTRVFIPAWF